MTTADRRKAEALVKKLTPAVKLVLIAKTIFNAERERVDKIMRDELEKNVYWSKEYPEIPRYRITEPGDFMMDEEGSAIFYPLLNKIHLENGFAEAANGKCPALVAQGILQDAERHLVSEAEEFFPMTWDRLLCGSEKMDGLKTLKTYIDLLIKTVVNHPSFTQTAKEILDECASRLPRR